MRKDRFVLDTNIWISYLITKSEQKLINIISVNDLVIFSCNELFKEITRVLNYPHLKKYNVDVRNALQIVKNATVFYQLSFPLKRYVPMMKQMII